VREWSSHRSRDRTLRLLPADKVTDGLKRGGQNEILSNDRFTDIRVFIGSALLGGFRGKYLDADALCSFVKRVGER
jgi:hypothetical protein